MRQKTLIFCVVAFAGGFVACAPQPRESNWAIDLQQVYCANTRATGFVLGDPRAFSSVPIVPILGQPAAAIMRLMGGDEPAVDLQLDCAA